MEREARPESFHQKLLSVVLLGVGSAKKEPSENEGRKNVGCTEAKGGTGAKTERNWEANSKKGQGTLQRPEQGGGKPEEQWKGEKSKNPTAPKRVLFNRHRRERG